MRIFISYSRSDLTIADGLATALAQEGHNVFFDRDSLPAAEEFHARIRKAIENCDLFIFLVSPASIEPTCYAMTELALARRRWRSPSGRILPVIVQPTQPSRIPPYLSAVTYVPYEGNRTAETLAVVQVLTAKRRKKLIAYGAWSAAALAIAAAVFLIVVSGRTVAETCYLKVKLSDKSMASQSDRVIDVSLSGATSSFVVSRHGEALVDLSPLNGVLNEWILSLRSQDVDAELRPTLKLYGCPGTKQQHWLTKDINVTIEPR